MSDEHIERGENPETEFETQDLSAGGILGFLLGMAIFGIITYAILLGMYKFMDRYDASHQPPPNPLTGARPGPGASRLIAPDTRQKFPEPRLEVNERTEIGGFRLQEEDRLNSYGWVDEKSGTVRIPIDRAMQLIAQRGLPVRPQNGAPMQPSGKRAQGKAGTARQTVVQP